VSEAGDVLADRYRLEARIGAGGAADVWRANDELLGRPVAIKLLRPALSDLSTRDRFRQEARAAARLRHPHVVTVYDLGEGDDRPYIVLELVDGPSLADVLAERGPLAPAIVAAIGRDVAGALGEAHGHDLVHRDVKPANVLVTRDGEVKVADFGIVKALNEAETRLTATGIVVGTATYLAPEQLGSGDIDARTDVYALGLVLHECLTGAPPFEGGTTPEVAMARLTQQPPRIADVRGDVPAALGAAVSRALARDPEERFANGQEFAAELAGLVPESAIGDLRGLVAGVAIGAAARRSEDTADLVAEASSDQREPEDGGGTADATVAVPPVDGRPAPRSREPAASARDESEGGRTSVLAAVSSAVGLGDREDAERSRGHRRRPGLLVLAVIALAALVAVFVVASPDGEDGEEEQPDEPIEVVAAEAFDPFGSGEHPDRAPNAHDGDGGTTWTTQRYNSADLGGLKPGVGIHFDLGESVAITGLEIDLVAGGADIELYAFDEPPSDDIDDWGEPVEQGSDVPAEVRFEFESAEGRYWLVWLTSLPSEGGRHRAEISDVRFHRG
jgi:eukaryotic-like serine/threonine-protein kinase